MLAHYGRGLVLADVLMSAVLSAQQWAHSCTYKPPTTSPCMYLFVYMHIYIYTYIYIHTHLELWSAPAYACSISVSKDIEKWLGRKTGEKDCGGAQNNKSDIMTNMVKTEIEHGEITYSEKESEGATRPWRRYCWPYGPRPRDPLFCQQPKATAVS